MSEPSLEKILYVEDDTDIQVVARMALETVGGFRVRLCASGEEALREAPAFAPDLILLDVMMPDMDGPATLKALRGLPTCAGTPVIFFTAKTQKEEREALTAHEGVLGVIAKPFDPMTLPQILRDLWEQV